jgi:hypothetical protein
MRQRRIGPQTVRRYRRPRCIKGQRHVWALGAATAVSPTGQLVGPMHLRGVCGKCRKVKTFHPHARIRRVQMGRAA